MQGANVAVSKAKAIKVKVTKAAPAKKAVRTPRRTVAKAASEEIAEVEVQGNLAGASDSEMEKANPSQVFTQKELFIEAETASEVPDNSSSVASAAQPDSNRENNAPERSHSQHRPSKGSNEVSRPQPSKANKVSELTLKLSESLVQRLKQKANAEGVAIEEFASELLSEGLVLRAWEIMERKSALRQPAQSNARQGGGAPQRFNNSFRGNNQSGGNFNGNRPRQPNNSQGHNQGQGNRRNNNNFKNIMEDNASFLEYVRNQEKRKGL